MRAEARCALPGCREPAAHRVPARLVTRGQIGAIFVDVCGTHFGYWVGKGIVYPKPVVGMNAGKEATAHGP